LGGQTAVVGTFTPFGDYEQTGAYFVEVSGTSGLGTLKLAVDGDVTTLAVPESVAKAWLPDDASRNSDLATHVGRLKERIPTSTIRVKPRFATGGRTAIGRGAATGLVASPDSG
jgi:hypothetical protein